MTEILYTGDIPVDDLPRLASACNFSARALVLAEQLPDHVITNREQRRALLQFEYFPKKLTITNYHTGRIFQADAELRWEKQRGQMHVLYIGPEEYSLVMLDYKLKDKRDVLAALKKRDEPRYYYLFGERLRKDDLEKIGPTAEPGDFAEVRIPRLLRYRLDAEDSRSEDSRYARLAICEYTDKETGEVLLFRFQTVEPWE